MPVSRCVVIDITLAEYLIEIVCDLQTKKFERRKFYRCITVKKRNRKLLETLIERETIQIDYASEEITVTFLNNRSQ
jgi:hypothetical protein